MDMVYLGLDDATKYEIRRMYREESMTVEELSDIFGIPESLVSKVLVHKA